MDLSLSSLLIPRKQSAHLSVRCPMPIGFRGTRFKGSHGYESLGYSTHNHHCSRSSLDSLVGLADGGMDKASHERNPDAGGSERLPRSNLKRTRLLALAVDSSIPRDI